MITIQLKRLLLTLLSIILCLNTVKAQLSPSEAGYIDAVTEYGSDNTGATVTTAQLQAAIDAAANQKKALFLPAGTYLIDKTLECKNLAGTRENPVIIVGSSVDPNNRTIILLKEGTFTNAGSPKVIIHNQGYTGYDAGFPNTFNRLLHSIDIKIQGNNAGAIALAWRGAEGCSLFDVHIDVTGGFAGINAIMGSGGSSANISITGGRYGIYLANDACQPTPTFTDIALSGQTHAAVYSYQTRGSLVFTGAKFIMNNKVPVFDLARHTGFTWSPGGNPVLTDCVIDYSSPDSDNHLMVMVNNRDQSVFFMDVYVKNAATILSEDATANGNANGWRYYKKFAYNSGWNLAPTGDEPVYIEGVKVNERLYQDYADNVNPPSNIQSKHGWGKTFPSFQTSGAVNVNDYIAQVDNGDWAPAFNAAIIEAENNGSNVVFVPAGSYIIYNSINLKSHTALVGCGHPVTKILGRDDAGRRFGGSTNAWSDPKPMITTPDDKNATCILADLSVSVNGPFNSERHTNEAMACYAIHWQAGNNSIIRNIDYMHSRRNNYRTAWALVGDNADGTGMQTKLINLRSLDSPSTINGMVFSSESKMKWHLSPEIPSRILLETVNGNKRIMPRSMPPKEIIGSTNSYEIPNISITKSGDVPFNITSLKITNAAWDATLGDTVVIKGTGGNGTAITIDLRNTSRENLQNVALNWTGVTKIEITSSIPFSLDDIVIDTDTIDFEDQSGSMLVENTDWNHWLSGMPYMYLPIYYMAHEYVTIEGGCKWYNHWKHGSTWINITKPYVLVQNNDPDDIVSFYHFHAQHSQNFYKLKVSNAHNVSFFGAKTENILEFARAENSDNIRFFGHGGMTNPSAGTAHYRMENCTNWAVVSPTDEVDVNSTCTNCGLGDAMLPKTAFGTYEVIHDMNGDILTKTDKLHRPILYMRGNPTDPWGAACDTTFGIGVKNGLGSGNYCEGESVWISAIIPECKTFLTWSGDTSILQDPSKPITMLTMPADSVSITAVFEDLPYYSLLVIGGSGTGSYCNGSIITIEAPATLGDEVFDAWTGNGISWLNNVSNHIAIVTMPGSDIALIATYKTPVNISSPSENHTNHLSVFPNPVNENLQIQTSNASGLIQIKNIMGQVLLQSPVTSNAMVMNLSALEAGFYLVQYMMSDGGSSVCQIIKN